MIKEIALMQSEKELRTGEMALRSGNTGKARVCARRACSHIISHWLESNRRFNWGNNAVALLEGVKDEENFPENIRLAAERLTARADSNFTTGYSESPIEDARIIIKYFSISR